MWRRVKALRVLLPRRLGWRKVLTVGGVAGLVALAFCYGRYGVLPQADAKAPQESGAVLPLRHVGAQPAEPGRPVAYVYNAIPITRQELGEYLIARVGASRLDYLINHKIIEQECRKRGITVTDAEVEAQLTKMLVGLAPNLQSFVELLKKQSKTLYEYKEDFVRPQIALRKLAEGRVRVEPQDVLNAFEAKYGPKVQCRMIVLPKDTQKHHREETWDKVRKDETAFDQEARKQFIPVLASSGGEIPPIHKHFADEKVEKVAFSLQPGDVSELIQMPDGNWVILRCEKLIDREASRQLDVEELALRQEVFEKKLGEEIAKMFQELRRQADPKVFLEKDVIDPQFAQRVNRALQTPALEQAKQLKQAPASSMQGN
jgi:parvulin-like peptidyl-prolyl isomerase